MATVQRSPSVAYNYEDYVPHDGIACPICETPCSSLEMLNSHLDVAHTEEDSKGALLSWFRTAHKKVQTTLSAPRSPAASSSNAMERSFKQLLDPNLMNSFSNLNIGNSNPVFFASDVDRLQCEVVTREHWQREGQNDVCSFPRCGRSLGRMNKQHCRHCGKLSCDTHMQYEMKLDRNAQHDPEYGIWCRVCAVCYTSRKGYMDHQGATRSLTATFLKRREKVIDRVYLESSRLEKRLEKLARVHYVSDTGGKGERLSPSSSLVSLSVDRVDSGSSIDSLGSSVMSSRAGFVSNGNSILSMKLKYRDGEQAVTKWENDKNVTHCPLCAAAFTITNRKHHCRLCGRVVCGNTGCSKMIPLFLDMTSDNFDQEPVGDTRSCRDCERFVFRRRLRHEFTRPMAIAQLYQQLMTTRQNIEKLLPLFHDIIVLLDKEKIHRQPKETFQKAAMIRKSLVDNFALFDTLAKNIKTLPAKSSSMRRLQSNVYTAASIYLQQNMLPLQMLPRILKPEKKNGSSKKMNGSGGGVGHASRKQNLQLQLQAFKEQQMLVEGYVREAQSNRKFDDVRSLKMSLDELRAEILRIQAELGNS